jgi:hypothetical protein
MNKHIQKAQQHITRAIELLTGGMDIRMQRAKTELYEASAALQIASVKSKEAAPSGGGCSSVRELLEQMKEDLQLGDTLSAGQHLEEALKSLSPTANTRQMELAQEIQSLELERRAALHGRDKDSIYLDEQQLINAAIDLANVINPVLQDDPIPTEEEDESLLGIMYGDERDDPLTVEEESALYWCPGCGLPYADCNCPEDEITKEVVVEPELSKAPIVIPEPIPHHWHYVDMAFADRTSRVETNSLQHAHEVAGRKDVIAYRVLDQQQNNAVVFDNGYEAARTAAELESLGQLMKVITAIKGAK